MELTPKEKAKELVDKFNLKLPKNSFSAITYKNSENRNLSKAKQCALICVDYMLALDLRFFDIEFLKEVKQEINKMEL